MQSIHVFTIGHSNHPLEDFIGLLSVYEIDTLIDVRVEPASRRWPHFNESGLREALAQRGVAYHWAGRFLGGRRAASEDSPHIALQDSTLRGYADHMQTPEFQRAAAQLVRLAARSKSALMCAERLPQQCHRALLADYLLLQGHRITHVLAKAQTEEHQLNPLARRESATLIYDRFMPNKLI